MKDGHKKGRGSSGVLLNALLAHRNTHGFAQLSLGHYSRLSIATSDSDLLPPSAKPNRLSGPHPTIRSRGIRSYLARQDEPRFVQY